METEPDYTNVVFIDEYPELKKRVWLRRLNQERLGKIATGEIATSQVLNIPAPRQEGRPDGAA